MRSHAGKTLLLVLVLVAGGCTSPSVSDANYPVLESAFGVLHDVRGSVLVTREDGTREAADGDKIFVGDTLETAVQSSVNVVLAPGQVVSLPARTRWRIVNVISNGAAYGSDSTLEQGAIDVHGDNYMPHRFLVRSDTATVVTLAENFSMSIGDQGADLRVVSRDAAPIRVGNDSGSETLKQPGWYITVNKGSAPIPPVPDSEVASQ